MWKRNIVGYDNDYYIYIYIGREICDGESQILENLLGKEKSWI